MSRLNLPGIKRPSGSGVKVPKGLTDLGRDLRDTRLLPLVAVLAVAIVAVPLVLKRSEPSLSPTTGQSGLAAPAGVDSSARMVVVADAPGLRDYKRRLSNLTAKDPFKQHFAAPEVSSSGPGVTGTASTTSSQGAASLPAASTPTPSSTPTTPTTPSTSTGSSGGSSGTQGSGGAGNGGGTEVKVQTKYASNEIDVRIVRPPTGKSSRTAKSSVRRGLPELSMLPSRKTPVAIFMGVSSDGEKALLLVSSDVNSVFGDGRCVIGSETCQLLALKPGLPETFIYGGRNRAYRIEILGIHKVIRDHPQHSAALGK